MLKIIRFLRVLKLLRFFKLNKLLLAFEEIIIIDEFMILINLLKIMVRMLFIVHWLACFYWAVSYSELDSHYPNWISSNNLLEASLQKQYVTSLYWAIQTMCTVGYGDVPPITKMEELYVVLSMLILSAVYALTLNQVSSMVKTYNVNACNYREQMLYVN